MNWHNLWITFRYGVNQPRCAGVRPSLRLLDNLSGARMATRMLLNNGHQRIGYLSSNHGIEDDAMRKAGWMSALKSRILFRPESWIGTGTPDMPGGEAAMVELLGAIYQ